jgi:FAD/FMN-containing dehydrogenase
MVEDYTRLQSMAGTLQEALDDAFGAGTVSTGSTFKPASVDEVSSVIYALHSYGGSVAANGTPAGDQVALDLTNLVAVRDLDSVSGLVTVEAGMTPASLNEVLAEEGLCVQPGHFSEPAKGIGAAIERGEAGALIVSLGGVLADGTVFHTPIAPRRATGPNPDALLLGTQGAVAMVVWVTLRLQAQRLDAHRLAFSGPRTCIVETTRQILRTSTKPGLVTIRVTSDGRYVVDWTLTTEHDAHVVEAAFEAEGAKPVEWTEAAPVPHHQRWLPWSAISERMSVRKKAERCQWVGPLDMHGGWARLPGLEPQTDARLQTVQRLIDPLETLGGRP